MNSQSQFEARLASVIHEQSGEYCGESSLEVQEIRAAIWAKIVPASQAVVKPVSNVRVIHGTQY